MNDITFDDYVDDRLIYRDPSGYVLIVPKDLDLTKITPISCPKCGVLFRSKNDEEAFLSFGTCDKCSVERASTSEDVERSIAARPRPHLLLDVDL